MAITISGENNNDRILASDGVIDSLSGFNVVGVITATSFTGNLTGDVTGNLIGNVTGNINNSTLLLQTGGYERLNIASNGKSTFKEDVRIVKTSGALLEVTTNTGAADATLRLSEGATGSTTNGGGMFYSGADNKLHITCGTDSTTKRITIIRDDGKVGIGTDNPLSGVHISDGTPYGSPQNSNRKGTLTISAGSNISADIQLLSANYNHIFFGDAADPNTGMIWYEHTGSRTDSLNFATAGQERIHITSDGVVLIGTENADSIGTIASHLVVGSTTNNDEVALTLNVMEGTNNRRVKFFLDDDDGEFGIDSTASTGVAPFVVRMAASEKLRITSAGKVGINIAGSDNTSPVRNLDIADSSGAILRLISTDDSLGANERLGEIEFYSDDDDNAHIGAFIKAIADPSDAAGRRTSLLFGTQNHDASVNAVEKVRIDCNGNLSLGNSTPAKKVHISTTGNQKILIDPNYNNNTGGSSNSEADANNIVESILIRTSFGSNAATQTNAGHKWGIKFQGYNGNDFTQATSKCAGVFAVSEDEGGGYNRQVGLTFHTSPYNTNHREVMRINNNGAVTKPYQYAFLVATSNHSKTANWSHITDHSIYSSQCTGVADGTYWSNSTQRFTAPVTGVYNFYVGGWSYGNSNGSRYAYSFKHQNDNTLNFIGGGDYCSGDSPMAGWSRVIKLTAGEWVELWGYSAISVRWGGGHRFFWGGYLLG